MHPDDRGEQRGAHDPADPGAVPFVQRGTAPYAPYIPASRSPIGTPTRIGLVRPGARQGHQAGLALRDLVVAGAAAFRAVMAEPGDGQHHEPRVELVQPLDGEAEPVEDAGAEVLDEDVGLRAPAG